ncbi:ferredoxin III, nif-specific [Acidithiobacillus ferrooxidans ATCC 53993]|uniref:ferredoxin III, nif-specific n=1 Tax=Acidithiobacillus ferrooxidans TaxID=920 RepID=UPI00017F6F47|nr:ferredoxin III, nif-specific [Acidithiobacillus ferrooxidans]ACH83468.1 ferredoxin III, nif-specific [Acidithiobacillus ferrooxidans ATCC 53993]
MHDITGITKGGLGWTPQFVEHINQEKCIGCGRCFRACGRDVLNLVGITEEGELVAADDDEAERKFMKIAHPEKCIGCEACSRVCPKNCYTHASMSLAVSVSA